MQGVSLATDDDSPITQADREWRRSTLRPASRESLSNHLGLTDLGGRVQPQRNAIDDHPFDGTRRQQRLGETAHREDRSEQPSVGSSWH
jgi:hypothetical protein